MKQSIIFFLLLFIMLSMISGCNSVYNKEEKGEKEAISKVEDKNSINLTGSPSPLVQENADFYGTWEIKKKIAFGRIYELSDEQINDLIGEKIEYSPNFIKFGKDIFRNPKYSRYVVPEKEFFNNNGYTDFKEVGLKGNSVIMIDVECDKEDEDNFRYSFLFVKDFFIKDKDTLIASQGGVFFELKRVKEN